MPLARDLRAVPAARGTRRTSRPRGCRAASGRCSRSAGRSMGRPRALLLDEPSLGLAPVLVAQIMSAGAPAGRHARAGRAAGRAERAQRAVDRRTGASSSTSAGSSPSRSRTSSSPTTASGTPTWGSECAADDVTKFIDLTLNGISTGAIYAAVALALVLIWRSTRIVNFAQGAMLMFTTFIASAVINGGGSYVLGFVVALASGLVLGAVVERVIVRPVENAPPLERGDPDARPVHVAGRDRGDDLGQHAALVPGRVLAARLQGRRHQPAVHARTTRSSCSS